MDATTVPAKLIVKILLVILGFVAAIYFVNLISQVVIWVFIALFLALAFGPPVEWLHSHKIPRTLAIFGVYFAMLTTIFLVGLLLVPPVVEQVEQLSQDIPGYIDDLTDKNKTFREYDRKYDITDKLQQQAEKLPETLGTAAGALKDVTVSVFTQIGALVTILVMTFFLLQDGGVWWRKLIELQPPERASRMRDVGAEIYKAVGGYVGGNLLISVIAGVITGVTLSILGISFAVPLAVLMAFLDLIPLIGATLGGVIIAIVTLFVDFPTATIVWMAVFLTYQQLENHLIQPQIYKRSVKVHPLLVIVAILIGAVLLGVLGALLAIPVAAACQIFLKDLWAHRPTAQAT